MWRATAGGLPGETIMSPRPTSSSSASTTVAVSGGSTDSAGPRGVSMRAIVEVSPEGSTSTSSPVRSTPPATRPA